MSIPDADSVKMFIGQIPRTMEEDELKKMMEEYGPVYQLGIIRDRGSGQHRGKYFLHFEYFLLNNNNYNNNNHGFFRTCSMHLHVVGLKNYFKSRDA